MTIVQLEYVVAVDTYRNFSLAAEKCFVTQPTLSMQIQKLEDQLGVILFDRQKKPVIPTLIGTQLIEQARTIINESRKIKNLIAQYKGEVAGELRLGIIPTVAPYLLPLFLPDFLNSFPAIQLVIEELTTEEILVRLNKDLLDIGILATPIANEKYNELPLYQEKMLAYVSPLHRYNGNPEVDLSQVKENEVWLLSQGHCFRSQALQLCNQFNTGNHQHHFVFESGSIETIIKILQHHSGLTIVPETAALYMSAEQKLGLKPIKGSSPGRQISIISRRTFLKQNTVTALAQCIDKNLPKAIKDNQLNVLPI